MADLTRRRVLATTSRPTPATAQHLPATPCPSDVGRRRTPTARPDRIVVAATTSVPATASWAGRLLQSASSPPRRWLTGLILAAILGGISITAPAAIYVFAAVAVDIVGSALWFGGRTAARAIGKRRGRGRR